MSDWSPEPHELFTDNDPSREPERRDQRELEEELCHRIRFQSTFSGMIRIIKESDWLADMIAQYLETLADDYPEISSEELRHIATDVRARVL
ncbi:MAG TPA: hypothetical protein VHK27_13720 [Gammaproteobacteria bacterium]|nr:hypothetical protein [Gammaproteobacteria bacterium]